MSVGVHAASGMQANTAGLGLKASKADWSQFDDRDDGTKVIYSSFEQDSGTPRAVKIFQAGQRKRMKLDRSVMKVRHDQWGF